MHGYIDYTLKHAWPQLGWSHLDKEHLDKERLATLKVSSRQNQPRPHLSRLMWCIG